MDVSLLTPAVLKSRNIPGSLARRELVLDVINGISGTLANGALRTNKESVSQCPLTTCHTGFELCSIAARGRTYSLAFALSVDELLAEVVVLGPVLAGAVDDDLLVVVRQLVDDVLVLLVELELVVRCYALLVDGGSVGDMVGLDIQALGWAVCLVVCQVRDHYVRSSRSLKTPLCFP